MTNIVENPHVAVIFMIPGISETLRVNGRARLSIDPELCASFAIDEAAPRSVIVLSVDEVYFQCARAVMRSRLWDGGLADPATLPTIGEMLEEMSRREIDGAAYDREWPGRAAGTLW